MRYSSTTWLLACCLLTGTALGLAPLQPNGNKNYAVTTNQNKEDSQSASRRQFAADLLGKGVVGYSILGLPSSVQASVPKSRTEGYAVQMSGEEWKSKLTPRQYEILREGGTERPYTSILEAEERPGTYSCAGCGTELFQSKAKFHSGTGWPSFATALEGVEVKKVTAFEANLAGAEIRCATCGGHLGDVFNDGWIFPGTPAYDSGKRFCVDGSALVFRPVQGDEVMGDLYPQRKAV